MMEACKDLCRSGRGQRPELPGGGPNPSRYELLGVGEEEERERGE
jgi:hypothetical protein